MALFTFLIGCLLFCHLCNSILINQSLYQPILTELICLLLLPISGHLLGSLLWLKWTFSSIQARIAMAGFFHLPIFTQVNSYKLVLGCTGVDFLFREPKDSLQDTYMRDKNIVTEAFQIFDEKLQAMTEYIFSADQSQFAKYMLAFQLNQLDDFQFGNSYLLRLLSIKIKLPKTCSPNISTMILFKTLFLSICLS